MEEQSREQPPARVGLRGRTTAFVRARSRTQRVGAVAAVALLASAPFGGLRAEADPAPARLQLGKPVDIGPFEVTVEKVLSISDLEPVISPQAGHRLFVVKARVRNPTHEPHFVIQLGDAFYGRRLGVIAYPGADQPRGRVFQVSDGSALGGQINPGLSYQVAIVFEQRGDWRPDRPVLGLNRYVFRADDPQTLDPDAWILDRPIAQGPVDVEVKQ